MKCRVFKFVLLLVAVLVSRESLAEPQSSILASVKQMVAEYGTLKGVNCVELHKGHGLGLVKAILRPKLGKEFLDGVNSIIIIEHTKASNEICHSLWCRLEGYAATHREFRFDNNEFGGGERVRGYVAIDETTMIASELVMSVDDKGAKLLIYMGGVLDAKKMDLAPKQ